MSSHTIDNEVVELEFNNSKFENNVKESMSTLDKLKSKLNFDGATKGLDEIEKASSRIDFSGMSNGIDALSNRFDTFGIMGMTIIQNLTNKLVDFSLQLGKSITIDQVSAGWSKMDQMTGSVQTLVNATGKSVEDIYTYLDRLMWYSDETSYSFTDMTSALSQMVSSGGNIDKLIPMITGIANATAYAGKGAREFQSTIRNLTQSYQAGYLQYQDVKSLNLMGTSSKALKETFISVAEEMGKVRKGYVTLANFDKSLADKWATTEVMEETFNRFSALSEAAQKAVAAGEYQTASEAIEALSKDFDQLAVRSFKSAQEAKTFTEAISATKDAVSSDWMKIFNDIFGTYDQQVKTWTQLSYDLYDLFVEPLNSFEEMIKKAFNSKWGNFSDTLDELGVNVDGLDDKFVQFIKDTQKNTPYKQYEDWSNYIDDLIAEYGSLDKVLASGKIDAKKYAKAFIDSLDSQSKSVGNLGDKLTYLQSIYDGIWSGKYGNGADRVKALTEAGVDYATAQGMIDKLASSGKRSGYKIIAEDIAYLSEEQLKSLGFTNEQITEFESLREAAEKAGVPIDELIESMGKRSGQELLADTLSNLINIVNNLKNIIGDAWTKVFDPNKTSNHIYDIVEAVESLTRKIRDLTENSSVLSNIFVTIFSVIRTFNSIVSQVVRGGLSILQKIFQSLKIDVKDFSLSVGDAFKNFSDWIVNNDVIFTALDGIGDKIAKLVGIVRDWFEAISKSDKFTSIVNGLKEGLSGLRKEIDNFDLSKVDFNDISEKLKDFAKKLAESPKDTLENFAENIGAVFSNIWNLIKSIPDKISSKFGKMSGTMDTFKERGDQVLEVFSDIATMLIGIGSGVAIFSIINKLVDAVTVLITPLQTLNDLVKSFTGVAKSVSGYIDALKNNIQTNNVIKLALALGILAVGLWALAKVDSRALWNAIGALGALMGLLTIMSLVFSKIPVIQTGAKDFASAVISLAGSVVILAIAVNMLKDLTKGQAITGVTAALFLLGGMVGAMFILGKFCKNAQSQVGNILSFSASVLIMSIAMRNIAKMAKDADSWKVAFLGLLECAGLMAGMMFVMSIFPPAKGSGTELVAFAGSLLLLALGIKALAKIGDEDYSKGMARIASAFIGYLALAWILKGSSTTIAGLGAAALGMSASLVLLATGIKAIAKISKTDMDKAQDTISHLLGVLTVALVAISLFSGKAGGIKQLAGLSLVILSLTASLYLIIGAILIIKSLNKEDVDHAAVVIGALMLAVGGAIALMNLTGALNKENGNNAGAAKALLSFAVIVGVLAAALFVLSSLDQTKLVVSAGSLIFVLLSLSLCMELLTKLSGNLGKALGAIGIMALVLASAVAALVILDKFTDGDGLLQKAESLVLVIGSLSVVCAILAVAGIAAQAAGPGLGYILAFLVALEAIIGVTIGLASQVDPSTVDKANIVLTKVAEIIGGFFGSIISSFLSSATSTLPEVGETLSKFMENMSTFFDKLNSVPSNASELFKNITDVIITFGSQSSQTALKRLSQDTGYLDGAKTFFDEYADIIVSFSSKINGKVNAQAVQAAADAGTMMASLNESLPTSGGILKIFTGEKSLTQFGEQMVSFADSLVLMSQKLSTEGDFNQEAVDRAKVAGDIMNELTGAIPSEGGLLQLITGQKDLGVFGTSLVTFAEGLVGLCTVMNNPEMPFDETAIEKAKVAGQTMTELTNNLPEDDSWKNKIFGGTALGDFGKDITSFAEGLVNLCNAINNGTYTEDVVNKALIAAQTMQTLIMNLPEEAGIDEALNVVGERINTGITTMMDGMIAIFNRSEDSKAAGYLTLQGYLEGVSDESLLEQLYQAGVRAAEAVNSGYENTLDINSPSEVMKKDGAFTIQGIIEGVKSKLNNLKSAGAYAAQTFKNSLENSLSLAQDTLDSDLHVTVTPVLDLSEIQNGASGLSNILDNTSLYANASGLGSQILNSKDDLNAIGNQLVVNTTFNIDNNGKDITEDTIDDWSNKIANSVNLKLGALYRR